MSNQSDHTTVRERGYLPHWERTDATYFVTFRLADALPRDVLDRLDAERQLLEARFAARKLAGDTTAPASPQTAIARQIEQYLDTGMGACYLATPAFASLVADALRYFDEKRYRLFTWCIMPNHVHVIVQPFAGYPLAKLIHSCKSYTAHAAARLRGSSGPFWQREYYDYLVRDETRFIRLVRYVLRNPVKARLGDWPWVYVREGLLMEAEQG